MSYQFYNVLHILGIVLVFMALAALAFHGANGGTRETNKLRGLVMATHGLGVVLIIVAGFGQLAKIQSMAAGLPGWLHPKLLVWVLLAVAPSLLSRKPEWGKAMWFILPLLAAIGAYFGITHGQTSGAPAQDQTTEQAEDQS